MSQDISLKQVERRVFTTAFQDGLWDILIGCFVLIFAIAPFLSAGGLGDFWSSAVFVPFWALAYLVIWLVRKHVVIPRVGVVKFGLPRKVRLSRFLVIAAVVGVAGAVLGILSALISEAPAWMRLAPFFLAVLIGFGTAAYFLDSARLYLYGLLIVLSPLVGEWLYTRAGASHHGYPITFGTTAGIIMLIGLIKLARLVHNHPIPFPAEEPMPAESRNG